MLPYSKEVLFTLFGELNSRYIFLQIFAFVLFLWTAYQFSKKENDIRLGLTGLSLLWIGCSWLWFLSIFSEINFLAPLYGYLAMAQGIGLGIIVLLNKQRKSPNANDAPFRMAIAFIFLYPLFDYLSGSGGAMIRLPGLHAAPLVILTFHAIHRLKIIYTGLFFIIPTLLAGVSAYEAYVLNLPQDAIPIILAIFSIWIGIQRFYNSKA